MKSFAQKGKSKRLFVKFRCSRFEVRGPHHLNGNFRVANLPGSAIRRKFSGRGLLPVFRSRCVAEKCLDCLLSRVRQF